MLEACMHLSITSVSGVGSLVVKQHLRSSLRGDLTFIESIGKSWTTNRAINRFSTLKLNNLGGLNLLSSPS